jgi:hypothetical protein
LANVSAPAHAPYRYAGGALTLQLHVQPGAARTGWAGLHGGALKLRLAAPPLEGRANRALVAFLAAAAGVPRSAVRIEHGEHGRDKRVRIAPLSEAQFRELRRLWEG